MKKLEKKKVALCVLVALCALSLATHSCSNESSSKKVDVESDYLEESSVSYSNFDWPDSEIAKLIPAPKSSIGHIDWEASYGFVIYVAETSKDDYDEYVKTCKEVGFNEDYKKGDDFYYADNADGFHIHLRYDEGDVMLVRIDDPDESEISTPVADSSEEPVATPSPTETPIPEVTEEPTPTPTEEPEVLTVDNCEDLANILSVKADVDPAYSEFSEKYLAKTIEFDASIAFVSPSYLSGNYYDVLLYSGDYNETDIHGPSFRMEGLKADYIKDDSGNLFEIGDKVRVRAMVGVYNENSGLFSLTYKLMKTR